MMVHEPVIVGLESTARIMDLEKIESEIFMAIIYTIILPCTVVI